MNNNILIIAITSVLVSACTNTNHGDGTHAKEMNGYLESVASVYINNHDLQESPITAVAISAKCGTSNPMEVYAGTFGKENLKSIDENSLFQIGSITKSFVAVVVLQLAREYNFSLNDKVSKWFPEYQLWHDITILQLLNMTSGIPNYLEDISFYNTFPLQKFISPASIIDFEKNKPLSFNPGSKYHYSNTN